MYIFIPNKSVFNNFIHKGATKINIDKLTNSISWFPKTTELTKLLLIISLISETSSFPTCYLIVYNISLIKIIEKMDKLHFDKYGSSIPIGKLFCGNMCPLYEVNGENSTTVNSSVSSPTRFEGRLNIINLNKFNDLVQNDFY